MGKWYILDENNKPLESTIIKYVEWEEANPEKRAVKQEDFGNIRISTVFLGLDHSWRDDRGPLLWETMIFGGEHDQYQQRHYSYEEALEGHQNALDLVNTK